MTTFSRDAELTPAYILHTRKYRDTSLIAELLTEKEGRVAVVIRGARGTRKKTGVVQPFTPILVSYVGRGELKTITKMEVSSIYLLQGENLLIGMYANELLVRLLGKFEAVINVFDAYQQLLLALVSAKDTNDSLRYFELTLLEDLGYGITFDLDAGSGETIQADRYYRYVPDEGFHSLASNTSNAAYLGEHLLQIANRQFASAEVEACAKKIIRSSLAVLLGSKPLKSREMFKKYQLDIKGRS